MKHPNTRALFRYWNDLRAGRAAPYRSELDPRAISSLLESTFILEHPRVGAPRFRLAGTRLCDQFGMELRGMSALALWQGDCRQRVQDLLREVVQTPCIGHVACTVETRSGASYQAEFLYLPLRSDLGEMTRIVGCGYYMGAGAEDGACEPLHHWIETVNVYQIASEETGARAPAEDAAARFAAEPAPHEATTPAEALKRAVGRLDRRRARRGFERPLLRAIEGGRAPADSSAAQRLRAELDRLDGRGRPDGAERAHLRLITGGAAPERTTSRAWRRDDGGAA